MILTNNSLAFQKNKCKVFTYVTPSRSNITPLNPSRIKVGMSGSTLTSANLIKPTLYVPKMSWSAGILSALLFKLNPLLSAQFSSNLSARKDWGLWLYMGSIFFEKQSYSYVSLFPWSIRIRRSLKIVSLSTSRVVISMSNNTYVTPKRRIKRWLKKKYTTASWR